MPTAVLDPFGNTIQACSVSTAIKAKLGKDAFPSEAAWAQHVKKDAYNTIRAKIHSGEIKKNTIIARAPGGKRLTYKGGEELHLITNGTKGPVVHSLKDFDGTSAFDANDWDFGPNMAQVAQAQKLMVDSPAKLKKWLDENEVNEGDLLATLENAQGVYKIKYVEPGDGDSHVLEFIQPKKSYGQQWSFDDVAGFMKHPTAKVEFKVGQTPDVPPAAGLPVSSTSKSVGAITNEDAATMFVKVKDKLAAEKGINIKGSSTALDDLVYKTIGDQAGYTPAEMKMKVEAYKGSGKKLSALKKKVLPKTGNPTKAATQKSVDNATDAVKKETPKPEEVPQVWESEAVAKAYVKAKDQIVASNDKGWTLYTKNPDFDAAILKKVQDDIGPIKGDTMATSLADYIANTQKLSVLKKQMIKKGELNPEADTLKGPKAKPTEPPKEDYSDPGGDPFKAAPTETGAGQTGKATEDPTVVAPKHELTVQQQVDIKTAWEGANLPLSSAPANIYAKAKELAQKHGFGDDVLPVIRWVDAYKTENFGLKQSENKKLYEAKVIDHLKNPQPVGFQYQTPSYSPPQTVANKTFGELPEDSTLFVEATPTQMTDMIKNQVGIPTAEQRAALKTYSGSSYSQINSALRAGGSVKNSSVSQKIQAAMKPLPQNLISRRGTSLKGLGAKSHDELASMVGTTFREPAFSSTAIGGTGQFGGEVLLQIQMPAGTSGVWLKPYSSFSHENEYLLSAGSRFEILKVEQKSTGYSTQSVVHVRVIGAEVK